jgi:hypothetical protein
MENNQIFVNSKQNNYFSEYSGENEQQLFSKSKVQFIQLF